MLAAGAMYALNPNYMGVLFFEPTGHLILAAAVASLSVGGFIMKTIISKSLS